MLNVKEGETYVCKRDDIDYWTLDKEYKIVSDKLYGLVLVDEDNNDKWCITNDILNQVFKVKEKTFDLNTLTTAQRREYLDLLENKENAQRSLNAFVERMTKKNE